MSEYEKKLDDYLKVIDNVIEHGKYKDNWESLAEYPVPQWYKDAKMGAFIHWGAYSVPAYFSEWYPRLMYYKCNPVYWHHNRKYGKDYPYSKFIEQFKAEKFNPKEWITLLKQAGMKYVMPVGEHHDGFKMYNSELSRWNSVNMAMKRDVLGELKAECDSQGVTFATSSHRAEHYWFMNGVKTVGYDNEALKPEYKDLYGECYNIHKKNNLVTLLKQEHGITPTKEWCEDWLVNSAELIDNYRPKTLFFDWWVMNYAFRPYMKKFLAYYFNRSLEWGEEVCVQYKYDAIMYNCSIFDRERGQLDNISPNIWQSETSTAYNSWSYCTTNKWKTPEDIACVMCEVIAKNGNFVLNIGPKSDGTICDEEKHIFTELGKWTDKNKEVIWGTTPYKVYGEGRKKKNGAFKERNKYTGKDFRFLYKTATIYAIALKVNASGKYVIKSLARNNACLPAELIDISIVGYDNKVTCNRDNKSLAINVEGEIDSKMPLCFKIKIN